MLAHRRGSVALATALATSIRRARAVACDAYGLYYARRRAPRQSSTSREADESPTLVLAHGSPGARCLSRRYDTGGDATRATPLTGYARHRGRARSDSDRRQTSFGRSDIPSWPQRFRRSRRCESLARSARPRAGVMHIGSTAGAGPRGEADHRCRAGGSTLGRRTVVHARTRTRGTCSSCAEPDGSIIDVEVRRSNGDPARLSSVGC